MVFQLSFGGLLGLLILWGHFGVGLLGGWLWRGRLRLGVRVPFRPNPAIFTSIPSKDIINMSFSCPLGVFLVFWSFGGHFGVWVWGGWLWRGRLWLGVSVPFCPNPARFTSIPSKNITKMGLYGLLGPFSCSLCPLGSVEVFWVSWGSVEGPLRVLRGSFKGLLMVLWGSFVGPSNVLRGFFEGP